MKALIVRRMDGTEVHRVQVSNEKNYEKVMLGLLRNMDTDNYYVDDSEFDAEVAS